MRRGRGMRVGSAGLMVVLEWRTGAERRWEMEGMRTIRGWVAVETVLVGV